MGGGKGGGTGTTAICGATGAGIGGSTGAWTGSAATNEGTAGWPMAFEVNPTAKSRAVAALPTVCAIAAYWGSAAPKETAAEARINRMA